MFTRFQSRSYTQGYVDAWNDTLNVIAGGLNK